ncbi:MAG: hypothetical protein WCP24_01645 [bacterium]
MLNEPVNIIFIHRGKADYLTVALKCARGSNPEANIFLISDNANDKIDGIIYKDINNYFNSAKQFAKNYEHLSTNTYEFELFCIERWFILRDFTKTNKLERYFHADSDVLIFSDLAVEWPKFSNFSFTLSENTCGHNSFWNNREALDNFCNFIENIYNKKDLDGYNKTLDFWNDYKLTKKPGGICDMTLFYFYQKKHPTIIGETAQIIDGSTYDHNFSSNIQGGVSYKNILGIKKIIWKNNLPYVKNSSGILVRLNTLHLQGWAKKFSSKFYRREKNILLYFLKEKILIYLKTHF